MIRNKRVFRELFRSQNKKSLWNEMLKNIEMMVIRVHLENRNVSCIDKRKRIAVK